MYCPISNISSSFSQQDRKAHFKHLNTFFLWIINVGNWPFGPKLNLVTRYMGQILNQTKASCNVRTAQNGAVLPFCALQVSKLPAKTTEFDIDIRNSLTSGPLFFLAGKSLFGISFSDYGKLPEQSLFLRTEFQDLNLLFW
jgi:hypothetical protein